MKTKLLLVSTAVAAIAFGCAHRSEVAQNETAPSRSPASDSTRACLEEAHNDGCYFNWDDYTKVDNAAECRKIQSKLGATKVILFRMFDGDIVGVTSKDPKRKAGSDECRVTRFVTGLVDSGDLTHDISAVGNRFFFTTNKGHLYLGQLNSQSNLEFLEILSGSDNSYAADGFVEEKREIHHRNGEVEKVVSKVHLRQGNDTSVVLDDDFISRKKSGHHTVPAKADWVENYKSGRGYSSPFERH